MKIKTRMLLSMVEGKGFIVDMKESAASGIWMSPDWSQQNRPGHDRRNGDSGGGDGGGSRGWAREEEKTGDRVPRGPRKCMGIKRGVAKRAELYKYRNLA